MWREPFTQKPRKRYQVWKDLLSNKPRAEGSTTTDWTSTSHGGMKPFFGKSIKDYAPTFNVRSAVVIVVSIALASVVFWAGLKAVTLALDPGS